jgi:4-amino-4-deoxy-L-arabinose transferase-like glycosyltransferase
LLCWLIPGWLVFEAVPTKLPHYTLPLYPAVFLLAGAWFSRAANVPMKPLVQAIGRVLLGAATLILGAGALLLPLEFGAPVWLGAPAALAAAAAGWFAGSGRLGAAFVAVALLYAGILQLELPGIDAFWIAPRVVTALRQNCPACAPDGAGVVAAGYAEPSLMFLVGSRLAYRPDGVGAARAIAGGRTAALVAEADVPGFLAEAARLGLRLREAATIDGFNYSRGKSARLRLFVS